MSTPGIPTRSASSGRSEGAQILSGTLQNVVGVAIAGIATVVVNLLLARTLDPAGFGVVTVVTQAAFVVSFATRAGMDMAVLRDVAVQVGAARTETVRAGVARAAAIAAAVSAVVAVIAVLVAGPVRSLLSLEDDTARRAVEAAAVGLPFLALTNVWLAATRGLKLMRHTLVIFWAGQPLLWIVLMLAGWQISETPWMAVLAYSLSWVVAAGAAARAWRSESKAWGSAAPEAGWLGRLGRYAGPRAPAALFSQLLFWTDLFVLTRFVTPAAVGVYSAVLRAGQVVVLFLTSVNLMFSPYVADLYARKEIDRLDRLFKDLTRWTLAATLPAFLVLAVVPESVLRLFGGTYTDGRAALLILLGGQLVNIATGSVGFVLIMVGRTGWDLVVYMASLAFDLVLAFFLASRYGIEGAALANALTFAVSNVFRLLLVRSLVGIQPYDRLYLRLIPPALAGAAAMVGAERLVSGAYLLELAAVGLVGAVVYLVVLVAVGLGAREKDAVLGRLRHRAGR